MKLFIILSEGNLKLFARVSIILLLLVFITCRTYCQIDKNKLGYYNSIADKLIKSALFEEKGYNLLKEL
ncbi:MAG: hypothetical protein C0412_12705, partial [Flavobacterium sp.]|nr:hypothetical protein [Flavobacterium sp.]